MSPCCSKDDGDASTCADALVQPPRAADRRGGHVTSRRTALWSTSPRGSQPQRLGHHCLAKTPLRSSFASVMQVISVLQGGVREAGKKYQQSYTRYMSDKIRPGPKPIADGWFIYDGPHYEAAKGIMP
eukprot:COSAG01_NODE_408_length_17382_cov_6.231431_1_plen_128_part_00